MFDNPFSMVVAIVAIVSIASIVRARYGLRRERHRWHEHDNGRSDNYRIDSAQTEAMRAEIKALKDRVAVLERLATDSNSALEREFEKLRQQD
ncbi:MAG TPA: hypothetical protein VF503_18030 [Sphingobium sp.]|uniref:hypothetical protein n=1 Tax=Sphingobium sp. TaxID=1912891 RepID=UPI002ED2CB66